MARLTITTDEEVVNRAGTTAQLEIIIESPGGIGFTTWNAAEHGIRVSDWGYTEWVYDPTKNLVVPSVYRLVLKDKNGLFSSTDNLLTYLFNPSYDAYAKDFQVTLKINGVVDFIGNAQPDSFNYNQGTRTFSFTCDPRSGVLNETPLFDTDGTTPLNQLGWTIHTWHSTAEILEAIFQQVSDEISVAGGTLDIQSDLLFTGTVNGGSYVLTDIAFDEIYQYVDSLFFLYGFGMKTMGDLLRKMATDWGCFAGFIHRDKAFFRKFHYYDSGNTQSLGTILNRKCTYKYPSLLGAQCRIANGDDQFTYYLGGQYSTLEDRYVDYDLALTSFGIGAYTTVAGIIARGLGHDGTYWVSAVAQSDLNSGAMTAYGTWLSQFIYRCREANSDCRVDIFDVAGINYDFTKCFTDDLGGKYQIIGLKKYIAKDMSTIDALYLGT